jgi:hypothetical protein
MIIDPRLKEVDTKAVYLNGQWLSLNRPDTASDYGEAPLDAARRGFRTYGHRALPSRAMS